MPSLEELFCSVDDFCQIFEPQWQKQLLGHNLQIRKRECSLSWSEPEFRAGWDHSIVSEPQ